MGLVLIAAPIAGLVLAFGAYHLDEDRVLHEPNRLRTASLMLVASGLASSIIFGLGLLTILLNKATWKDFSYSPKLWRDLKRGALYSLLIAVSAAPLFGVGYLIKSCYERYEERNSYHYTSYSSSYRRNRRFCCCKCLCC